MTSASEGVCRGCGRKILWIEWGGRKIPLDAVAPCYVRLVDKETRDEVWAQGKGHAFVSHFATCRQANQFSGRNRGTT
jgi:hypothetical protein